MAKINCKICGCPNEVNEGQTSVVCEACGTEQTIPNLDSEKKSNLFNRANAARINCDFSKAIANYEAILIDYPNDPEAHWGICLSRYGIEYVDDPKTKKKIPTCHRTIYNSIFEDVDYKEAIAHADVVSKRLYQQEAEVIDKIQKQIISISQKEKPYDVFICYKETDSNGSRTRDSFVAEDIYGELTRKKYKVFFSRISLESKLGMQYEPIIFAALQSAKVMLVIGSKKEYFEAVWVKNEWSRYFEFMNEHKGSKYMIPCYRDMEAYDMPDEFLVLQSQNLDRLGAKQDLLRAIDKIFGKDTIVAAQQTVEIASTTGVNVTNLLKRAALLIEDTEYDKADEILEEVLNENVECAEAYIYKVLIKNKFKKVEDLSKGKLSYELDRDYQKAIKFAKPEFKAYLQDLEATRKKNVLNEASKAKYDQAMLLFNQGVKNQDNVSLAKAKEIFEIVKAYSNAKEMSEKCSELTLKHDYDKAVSVFENAVKLKDVGMVLRAKSMFDDLKHENAKAMSEKCANKRMELLYEKALNKKELKAYQEAINMFSIIESYKDAKEQIEQCKKLEADAKKEKIYTAQLAVLETCTAKATINEESFKTAIMELKKLDGYKDSVEKMVYYAQRLKDSLLIIEKEKEEKRIQAQRIREERERQARIKRDKRIRNIKIATPIVLVLFTLLMLTIFLFVPLGKYNQAMNYIYDGNYSAGVAILKDLDFKDSDEQIKMVDAAVYLKSSDYPEAIEKVYKIGGTIEVKYDADGGKTPIIEEKLGKEYKKLLITNQATKDGYTFYGWTLNTYKVDYKEHTIILSLKASYTPIKYKITYNLDGGNIASSAPKSFILTDVCDIPEPTKTGHTFLGWTGTNLSQMTKNVKISNCMQDVSLTAHWEAKKYVITYDLNGGSSLDDETQDVTFGTQFELITPTRVGYTFLGWFEGTTRYTSGTWIYEKHVTLVAQWKANSYNITYNDVDDNDGFTVTFYNGTTVYSSVTLADGQKIEYPTNPIKSGYIFAGWYSDSECTTVYTFSGNITEDMNLYAKWNPINVTNSNWYVSGSSLNSTNTTHSSTSKYTITVNVDCIVSFKYKTSSELSSDFLYIKKNNSQLKSCSGTTEYISYTVVLTAGDQLSFEYSKDYSVSSGSDCAYISDLEINSKISWVSSAVAKYGENASFEYKAGSTVTVSVNYDEEIIHPVIEREGYTFLGWLNGTTLMEDGKWNITNDVNLFPKWEGNSHVLTFDANGGSVSTTTLNVKYGDNVTLPTPTWIGHTFSGWSYDGLIYTSGQWEYDYDMTLKALWDISEYSIIYNLNGGSNDDSNPSKYTYYSDEIVIAAPTKTGYTFIGWTTDTIAEPVLEYVIEENSTGNIRLTANWVYYTLTISKDDANGGYTNYTDKFTESATVSFDTNGGTSISSQVLNENTALVYPAVPTKTGYAFTGWYTTNECEELYDFTSVVTEDITLYAGWVAMNNTSNCYYIDVTNNYNSTSSAYSTTNTSKMVYFTVFETGTYTFYYKNGYNYSSYKTYFDLYNVSTSTTYLSTNTYSTSYNYYSFTANAGDVIYVKIGYYSYTEYCYFYISGLDYPDAGGQFQGTHIPTEEYSEKTTAGETISLTATTKPGYTFLGWYSEEDLVSSELEYEFTMPNEDYSLVAKWEANTYRITYNVNGGDELEDDKQTITFGTEFELITPTKSGYTFLGWYNGVNLFEDGVWNVPNNVTLYAGWEIINYSITYDLNDGTNNIYNPETYTYDDANITIINPTKTGYTFLGWTTETITEPTLLFVIETGSTGDLVLNANWSVNEYIITYDVNGGDEIEELTQTVEYNSEFELVVPTKTGYVFTGWYCGGIVFEEGIWNITGNVELVASWEKGKYNLTYEDIIVYDDVTVTFDYKCDDIENIVITLEDGDTLPYPTVPTRQGYVFCGWYLDENYTTEYLFTGSIADDFCLYAKWSNYIISNSSSYPWTLSSGVLTSTNKSNSSSSEYSITVYDNVTVSFEYKVSSESGYDYLYVKKNGTNIISISGSTSYVSYQLSMSSGDVLTFKYSKDGSQSSGSDCAYIKDLTVKGSSLSSSSAYYDAYGQEGVIYDEESVHVVVIEYEQDFDLLIPTREGYTFEGWYYGEELFEAAKWTYTEDIVLTARWVIYQLTISREGEGGETNYTEVYSTSANFYFDVNGGTTTIAPQTVTAISKVVYPTIPTRSGYSFTGWYTTSDCTELYDFSQEIIEDVTVYAGWKLMDETKIYTYLDMVNYNSELTAYEAPNFIANNRYFFTVLETGSYTIMYKNGVDSSAYATNIRLFNQTTNSEVFNRSTSSTIYTSYTFTANVGDVMYLEITNSGSFANCYFYIDGLTYPECSGTFVGKSINTKEHVVNITAGNTFELIATVYPGFTFLGWFIGDEVISFDLEYDFVMPSANCSIVAKFGENINVIKYDVNGGEPLPSSSQSISYGDEFELLTPTRTGYNFVGWYYGDDLFESGVWELSVNIELVARWEIITYNIIYDLDEGENSDDNPDTYNYDDEDIILIIPTKEGYTFLGWTTVDETEPILVYVIEHNSIGDISLTANWIAYELTISKDGVGGVTNYTDVITSAIVTFDTLGGSEVSSQVITESTKLIYTVPTRSGYSFTGWYTTSECTELYDFSQNIYTDLMLYAGWLKNSENYTSYYINVTNSNNSSSSYYSTNNASKRVYFTVFEAGTYTFYYKNGYSSSNYATIFKLGNQTTDTYLFSTTSTNTSFYSYTFTANAGDVLFVETSVNYYSEYCYFYISGVSYPTIGNFVKSDYSENGYPKNVTAGTVLDLIVTVQSGYSFLGWYVGDELISDELRSQFTMPNSNCSLVAKFATNEYTVTYDVNGGDELEETTQTITYNTEFELPVPTRTGYEFVGWYVGDDLFEEGTWSYTEDILLTAQWEIIIYNITYNLNGGNNALANPSTYTYESEDIILEIPTKEGYTFLGWITESNATTVLEFVIEQNSIGDITLTAQWVAYKLNISKDGDGGKTNYTDSILSATVTFNTNGGDTVVESQVISTTTKLTYPTVPTRNGYSFTGWYTTSECEEMYDFSQNIYKDITLYAGWKEMDAFATNSYIDMSNYTSSTSAYVASNYPQNRIYFTIYKTGSYTFYYKNGYGSSSYRTYINLVNQSTNTSYLNTSTNTTSYYNYSFVGNAGEVFYIELSRYSYTENCYFYISGLDYPTINGKFVETIVSDSEFDGNVTAGASLELVASTLIGNEFLGWYNGDELLSEELVFNFVMPNSDYSIVAKFAAVEYTVNYDVNGGESLTTSEIKLYYGDEVELPTPTRTGYDFIGWYYGENEVESGPWAIAEDCTLVAKWEAHTDIEYKIHIYKENLEDSNYTLEETLILTGTADAPIISSMNTYEGFVTPEYQNVTIEPDGSLEVFYYYDRIVSTITLVSNGGIAEETIEGKYGTSISDSLNASRTGFTFAGWYLEKTLITLFEETTIGKNDVTIYAYWAEENKPTDFNYAEDETGYVISATSYTGTKLVIPSYIGGKAVYALAGSAFANKTNFIEIVVPDTVISMGDFVFSKCTGLQTLTIPFIPENKYNIGISNLFNISYSSLDGMYNTAWAYNSGSSSCYGKVPSSLMAVNITNTSNLPKNAFYGCKNIVEINLPEDLSVIGINAFYGCTELLRLNSTVDGVVNIPENVIDIKEYTFYGCSKVEQYTMGIIEIIDQYAFSGNVSLVKFNSENPNEMIIPEGCISIGEYAFDRCSQIRTILISDSVEVIGDFVFSKCIGLQILTIPFVPENEYNIGISNLFNISYSSFDGMYNAAWAYSSYSSAYYGYVPSSLMAVNITNTSNLPKNAFYGCKNIVEINLPEDLSVIGTHAFYNCSSLIRVNSTVDGVVNIPENVTNINEYTFYGCSKVEQYTMGNIESIGQYAFSGNTSLVMFNSETPYEMIIPEGCISIGKYAFQKCSLIKEIKVPNSVTTMGNYLFDKCIGVEEISIPFIPVVEYNYGISTLFSVDSSSITGMYTTFAGYSSSGSSYYGRLPDVLSTVNITTSTALPKNAFKGCKNIVEINLPEDVTEIGSYAFHNCSSLIRVNSTVDGVVNIPENVIDIKEYTFYGCSKVEQYTMAGIKKIGQYAFSGNTSLVMFNSDNPYEMIIPDTCEFIETYAFSQCKLIKNIVVPNNVISLGNYVFDKCVGLEELTIPFIPSTDGIAYLGKLFTSSSYSGMSSTYSSSYYVPTVLKVVSVTRQIDIPSRSFYGCSKLTTVNLLEDCIIGADAFKNCTATVNQTLIYDGKAAWEGATVAFLGSGTQEDPYVISNAMQFNWFVDRSKMGDTFAGKYIVLTADINMNFKSISNPIGKMEGITFDGTFDGQGHSIKYFKVDNAVDFGGLFGINNGTIKNLHVIPCSVTTTTSLNGVHVGSLVALNNGVIENCSAEMYNSAVLEVNANCISIVGGLVGYNKGTIKNSYSNVSVLSKHENGYAYAGGLVGYNEGTIENSFSLGNVSAVGLSNNYSRNGGLVGEVTLTSVITNCYYSSSAVLTRYTSTASYCEEGTAKTFEEIIEIVKLVWDFDDWRFDYTYPKQKKK